MHRVALDLTDETNDAGQQRVRETREGDAPSAVSCGDGSGSAVERAVCVDPTGVQPGRHGTPAGWLGADAADLLPAAVVQSVGSGGRGSVVRLAGDAAVCRHRSGAGAGAG